MFRQVDTSVTACALIWGLRGSWAQAENPLPQRLQAAWGIKVLGPGFKAMRLDSDDEEDSLSETPAVVCSVLPTHNAMLTAPRFSTLLHRAGARHRHQSRLILKGHS